MPAILHQQFKIFTTSKRPIGAILWARADPNITARLESDPNSITADEWRSGPRLVLIHLIAPFGGETLFRSAFARVTSAPSNPAASELSSSS